MGGGSAQALRNPRDHRCHQIVTDRPNLALPTYFTNNLHEAYLRQMNSQLFVTQPGFQPGTYWLKDERAN